MPEMNEAVGVTRKPSGLKMMLFVLSEPMFRKAVIKALWHSAPSAAGIPRGTGTSSQQNDRSRQRWSFTQKLTYEVMSNLNTDRTMTFINLGYAGLEVPHTVTLSSENESNRYAIQLYDYLAKFCDLRGKDALEVGCGRGGGGAFLF